MKSPGVSFLFSRRRAVDTVLASVATEAGGLSVEIADVAGRVDDLSAHSSQQMQLFEQLGSSSAEVLHSSMRVSRASAEVDSLARKTLADMTGSRRTIEAALGDIRRLVASVTDIESQVDGLRQALQGVSAAASAIARVAQQTHLLAVNAAIEAARAGEAGRGFSVVAAEVKILATSTAEMTSQINATVGALSIQAESIFAQSSDSADNARAVEQGTHAIRAAIDKVEVTMQQLGGKTGEITGAAADIGERASDFIARMGSMGHVVKHNTQSLSEARDRLNRVTRSSEILICLTAELGCETVDTPYIEKARAVTADILRVFNQAIARGDVALDDLFDEAYEPIAGSDPQQYLNRATRFCEQVLPDIIDPVKASDPRITHCAPMDRRGYAPVHHIETSLPQRTGDTAWNTAHCRNRIFYINREGKPHGERTEPLLVETYRRLLGEGKTEIVKIASVQITVSGRHWGRIFLGYRV